MPTYVGRNASVKLGTNTVQELTNWALTVKTEDIDVGAFGSSWAKSVAGIKSWTAKLEGYFDISDTTGQMVLHSAWVNATLITNIRFYLNSTSYYTPDVTTDSSAGCRINSFEVTADRANVNKVSISVSGVGPIALV